jgi:hypothetical protein
VGGLSTDLAVDVYSRLLKMAPEVRKPLVVFAWRVSLEHDLE